VIFSDKFQRLGFLHLPIVFQRKKNRTREKTCRRETKSYAGAKDRMKTENFRATAFLKFIFTIAFAVLIFNFSTNAQTNFINSLADLRAQIDAHLNEPKFSAATWSVKVVALTNGKILYENHGDRLMSPASNSKLYPAALALTTFGGDYQIATPIFANGKISDGILHGNLIISGRGDPSWKAKKFGTNFWNIFEPFVEAITNAGIQRVDGDLIADATFFRGPPTGASWAIDDLEDSDGAQISALTLEDNYSDVRVEPGKNIGAACEIKIVEPDAPMNLVNRTRTVSRGSGKHLETWRALDANKIYVLGELPVGDAGDTLDIPVPRPAAWFGAALKAALATNGIIVSGKVRAISWPEILPANGTNLTQIGEVKSPPLRELLADFLKPSQNLEADLIFLHTGETLRETNFPAWETSEDCALAALEKFIFTNGIPADVHFDEGSGLSRNNLTSANATVALLQVMATNRWTADFENALPIAGVDGTIRSRMRHTLAENNVHAKTGTLRWANSLSGYVTTAAGEKLVFSIMLNRYATPPEVHHAPELDAIAIMLADFRGRSDEEN
jgi:D-alanyl-D-alanine carboxypeptidase/D-alanyl-D-alanine-endopeptidase (penicillin-binding protein 4)